MADQPEALRLADELEMNCHAGTQQCAAAELRRLHEENRKLKTAMVAAAEEISKHWEAHCDSEGYGPANLMHRLEEGIASEYGYTAGAFARLEAENARLRAWQQSAWQRGHAVGLNGLNEALRQMEAHKKSDAWGNTQLTEALLRAEEQRDELLEALKQHGAHHGNCDYMILLTSLPPMRKPCSCGLHAAIAKATGEKT
jgi:hypothetical protein